MREEAGCGDAALELAVLDDRAMEQLNRETAGCGGPTNILSFSGSPSLLGPDMADLAVPLKNADMPEYAAEGDDGRRLGGLALSADTLLRECFLYGQDAEDHCIRLLAHGLAHLTGLDHGPAMESLTFRLEVAAQAARRSRTF